MNICVICQKSVQGRKRSHSIVCAGECDRELARQRTSQWKLNNPDKIKERGKQGAILRREARRMGRTCLDCEEGIDNRHANCLRCEGCQHLIQLQRNRENHSIHKDEVAKQRIKQRFKINIDEWIESQNNSCAACFRSFEPGVVVMSVDHDHSCCPSRMSCCGRCVRGLLCRECNSAAGFLNDDATRILQLAEYFSKNSN